MKISRVSWGWAVLAVAAAHGALCRVAQAQAGSSPASDQDFSFFTVWILGGGMPGFLFVLPIEICSIATVAMIIEHFVTIQRDKLVPKGIIVELEALLDEEKQNDAIALCDHSKNYVTNVVSAALCRKKEGYEAMQNAAAAAVDEENLKLVHKISWLTLFGNIGPLMGLFGTVVGMVMCFTEIAMSETSPPPNVLARGIFTALVTTVWGLIVAMPALSFFFYFKLKVQRLSFEMSGVAMEIVERFKPAPAGAK